MPLKTHRDEQPTLNLTPMIDIVFLIIIFFMVGTKFTELERDMSVNVPQVANAGALTAAPERKIINVYRDGRITLDRQPITIGQLTHALAEARSQYPELGVLVRGDADGPLQNAVSVLNACRRAGISEMGIAVQDVPDGQ